MTQMARRRRRGFTLMEIVLVIALGLSLLIGGIALAGTVAEGQAVSKRKMEIRMIMDDVDHRVPGTKTAFNMAIGVYDPLLDRWSGAFASSSDLPASFFENVELQPSPHGYVVQLTGLEARFCRKLGARDFGRPKYVTHPVNCETQNRLRITRYAD